MSNRCAAGGRPGERAVDPQMVLGAATLAGAAQEVILVDWDDEEQAPPPARAPAAARRCAGYPASALAASVADGRGAGRDRPRGSTRCAAGPGTTRSRASPGRSRSSARFARRCRATVSLLEQHGGAVAGLTLPRVRPGDGSFPVRHRHARLRAPGGRRGEAGATGMPGGGWSRATARSSTIPRNWRR